MKNVWTKEEVNNAINIALQKALNDQVFARLALEKPYEALEQISGKEVSPEFCLNLIESRPAYDEILELPDFKKTEGSDEPSDLLTGRVSWNLDF